MINGACLIGQSGGPTAVINSSLAGVVITALNNPNITNVYGKTFCLISTFCNTSNRCNVWNYACCY